MTAWPRTPAPPHWRSMDYPQRAIVAGWLSHLLARESDEIAYRWPPPDEETKREGVALAEMGNAAWNRACRFAGVAENSEESALLWRRSLDEFSGPEES